MTINLLLSRMLKAIEFGAMVSTKLWETPAIYLCEEAG